jgi:hypothetical protein
MRRPAIVMAALLTAVTAAGTAAAAQPVSEAETLLFQTHHLGNVHAPATLSYTFHKEGSAEPGFDDEVSLTLADGKPAAILQFLTGARQTTAPAVDAPEGNPVLLGFLEHDIAEMQRLTGGSSSYFRKRIRLALAEAADVHPRHFTYDGKDVIGREVVITPYLHDPMRARFASYVSKRYTFIISLQVPGGVYQIRAAAGGTPVLMDETLTLMRIEHGGR